MRERCSVDGCERQHQARGLCKIHYDRERAESRGRRDDTVLRTRARNRATRDLIKAHRQEFDELYAQAQVDVRVEHERMLAAAKEAGAKVDKVKVLRLKPGPAGEDETIVERVRVQDQW